MFCAKISNENEIKWGSDTYKGEIINKQNIKIKKR